MSVLPRITLFLQYVLPRNSRNTQNLLAVYSPTEFTEYTEPSCCIFSHRFHRFTQNLLAVYSPTEFTEYTLSLQKKAIRLNNQGKTMIAKDSFVPLL